MSLSQASPLTGEVRPPVASTAVPLSTMLADLDATVEALLRREFRRHGLDRVDVAFETPTKDWAAALSAPTVNLFLYDVRESPLHHPMDWEPRMDGNRRIDERPPLRVDASFAISAWTREIEDEHRLLSQVLGVLYAYPELARDQLVGTLARQPVDRLPLHTRLASPRDGGHGFWGGLGVAHKASIDYRVTLSCIPGTTVERGPETRTPAVRVHDRDVPRGVLDERISVAGIVRDAGGTVLPDSWVLVSEVGAVAVSGPDGRFRFARLPRGTHTFVARTPDGRSVSATVDLPNAPVDLVVPGASNPVVAHRNPYAV